MDEVIKHIENRQDFIRRHSIYGIQIAEDPKIIAYQSKNGYSGRLVPWLCDSEWVYAIDIYDPFGDRVLHAGRATARTLEQLKKHVDDFPAFMDMINGIEEDDDGSDDI